MYNIWMEDIEEGKLVGVMIIDQSALFQLWNHKLSVYPSGFALGKSLGAALPGLGKPRPSLLFCMD